MFSGATEHLTQKRIIGASKMKWSRSSQVAPNVIFIPVKQKEGFNSSNQFMELIWASW